MSQRPETGPMKFGDDWTGLFIRGDNALYFAMELREFLLSHQPPEPDLNTMIVQEIQDLLASAQEPSSQEAMACVQRLIRYDDCVKELDPLDPRYARTPDDILQDLSRVQTELATLMGLTGDVEAQLTQWVLDHPGAEERSRLIRDWLELYDINKALTDRGSKVP